MAIRKRTWKGRHGVEQSAWVVDYFDGAGKRRLKTFGTKKEATDWSVTALHEVRQGTHSPDSTSKSVEEGCRLWIAHSEAEGLELSTIKQRLVHMRRHIAPLLGGEKVSSLTVPRIAQFDSELRDRGRSVAMRRKILTSLKSMLTFLQTQGLVAQNVARAVKVKSDPRNEAGPLREGVDFPTKAELRLMMDNATPRWRPLLVTAIFTGLRVSELRGLRWQDVDLENATVPMLHVRQRADNWGKIAKPKSKAGSRDIPLAPIVANTLRQWRAEAPASAIDLVFPAEDGSVQSYFNMRSSFWLPLQMSIGTSEGYGFHALRHAAASLFIAHLGWTPKRVQTVMGHASIQMTYDRYGHLFEDRESDREAMKKLEAAVVAA
jgi:integrase